MKKGISLRDDGFLVAWVKSTALAYRQSMAKDEDSDQMNHLLFINWAQYSFFGKLVFNKIVTYMKIL